MMRYKIHFGLVLLFANAFFTPKIGAQNILTLGEAITTALENNYGIQIAELEQQADEMQVYKANVGMGPVVDWNVNFGTTGNFVNQSFIDGRTLSRWGRAFNPNTNITLSLPLYDGGRMQAAYEQLALSSQLTGLQGKLIVQNTLYQVMETYYDIVRLRQTVDYLDKIIAYYEERVKITEERWNVGQGSKIDFLQSKTDLNAQLSALTRSQIDLDNAKTFLNGLLNVSPGQEFVVEEPDISENFNSRLELVEKALEENRDVLLLEKSLQINQKREEELKSALKPTIGLSSSVGYSYLNTNAGFLLTNQNLAANIGLSARWNLYDGGDRKTQLAISQINTEIIQTRQAQLETQIINEIHQAYDQYAANRNLLEFGRETQEIAEENLEISIEKFRLGGSTILELNEAQRAYDLALNTVVQAEFDLRVSMLDLLQLSGQLVE